MTEPFDPGSLDPDDPFEIDEDNEPHLYSHSYVDGGKVLALSPPDLYDIFWGAPLFARAAHPPADWMMTGEIPGGEVLTAPLAPARSGNPRKCRPIGLYRASSEARIGYRAWLEGGSA